MFGEQALFIYDYDKEVETLWLGDAGWEEEFEVVAGEVPELELGIK